MIYYIIFNRNWVDTANIYTQTVQQYSTHLRTNNTQNTENGTYITIAKLNIHNNKKLTKLGNAGHAPNLRYRASSAYGVGESRVQVFDEET
jgi:serine phosphatase RsbU (regulator of sigma subunit)